MEHGQPARGGVHIPGDLNFELRPGSVSMLGFNWDGRIRIERLLECQIQKIEPPSWNVGRFIGRDWIGIGGAGKISPQQIDVMLMEIVTADRRTPG